MKLWHCHSTRSLRVVWALEEMGMDCDIETMPFPPRAFRKEYRDINPLCTVPFLQDDTAELTESTAICLYLVEKFGRYDFGLEKDHPEYGDYLNWLFQSDTTLTFPLALVFRYSSQEPPERQQPQVVEDYAKWYLARLRRLDAHIESREFLCDNRFTIADVAIGYSLIFGAVAGLGDYFTPQTRAYMDRLKERPAFIRANALGEELNPFKDFTPSIQL